MFNSLMSMFVSDNDYTPLSPDSPSNTDLGSIQEEEEEGPIQMSSSSSSVPLSPATVRSMHIQTEYYDRTLCILLFRLLTSLKNLFT